MKKISHEYLIIGANPSGLQLGHFFENNDMDYCILEKDDCLGSFFLKYPRYKDLNLINNDHRNYENNELSLRWDLNSPFCDNPDLLFKNHSKEHFPNSNDFVKYLKGFAEYYKLNISYNSSIQNIKKDQNEIFTITCGDIVYKCEYLIVASGIPKQIIPKIEGIEG